LCLRFIVRKVLLLRFIAKSDESKLSHINLLVIEKLAMFANDILPIFTCADENQAIVALTGIGVSSATPKAQKYFSLVRDSM